MVVVNEPDRQVLFDSDQVLAWRVRHGSAATVVTFATFAEPLPVPPRGFGESFFNDRQIDAVHVAGRSNLWYQYAEMPALLAAVRAALGPGRRILTYGSSMSGFAALRFAASLGAVETIAFSPQYSPDPDVVPWERRWLREMAPVRMLAWPDADTPPPATVFYDPCDPDARHMALWAAERPVRPVPLRHAGHPAGTYLAETGLISGAVLDLVAGTFDAAAFTQAARARRRHSGQYLFTLSERQPLRRRRLALRLLRAAVAATPENPFYASALAMLLYRAGAYAEADALHRRVVAKLPDHALMLFRYSRFLQRLGRFTPALEMARRATEAGGSARMQRHLRDVERLARRGAWLARLRNATLHGWTRLAWQRGWRS